MAFLIHTTDTEIEGNIIVLASTVSQLDEKLRASHIFYYEILDVYDTVIQ
jgi:hypothetical protein